MHKHYTPLYCSAYAEVSCIETQINDFEQALLCNTRPVLRSILLIALTARTIAAHCAVHTIVHAYSTVSSTSANVCVRKDKLLLFE
jgi:hypothetical protein